MFLSESEEISSIADGMGASGCSDDLDNVMTCKTVSREDMLRIYVGVEWKGVRYL